MKGKNSLSENYDIYDYERMPDGSYIITRNGDFFLSVSGGETEARNIAQVLREEEAKAYGEMQKVWGTDSVAEDSSTEVHARE